MSDMTELLLILIFIIWIFSVVLTVWRRGLLWLTVAIIIPVMLFFENIDLLLLVPMILTDIGLIINFMREIGV